jgi:hypothetical protein
MANPPEGETTEMTKNDQKIDGIARMQDLITGG